MKQTTNKKQETTTNQATKPTETEAKPIWHTGESVLILKVSVIKDTKNEQELKAVKFYLVDGTTILYYPKNVKLVEEEVGGFATEREIEEKYNLVDFILKNKMLVALNEHCKTAPQEIVITYQEKLFNGVKYKTMFRQQFETIYYKQFHTTDENLQKQLAAKHKHELDLEMPMNQ